MKTALAERVPWPRIALVLTVVGYRLWVPADLVDDAYITLGAVENWVSGEGLGFNPGQRDHVLTTLLWPLLLAAARGIGLDVVLAAKALGAASEGLLVLAAARLGDRVSGVRGAGAAAAVFLIANPVVLLPSHGGMETALYLAALALALSLLAEGRGAPALAAAALAVWVRFDGLLAYALVLAWWWLAAGRRLPRRAAARAVTPSLLLLAGHALLSAALLGAVVPWSVRRKLASQAGGLAEGALAVATEFGRALLGHSAYWFVAPSPYVLLLPVAIGGLALALRDARVRRRVAPLLLFALLYAAAYVGSGNGYAVNFPWYFAPPLLAAAVGVGHVLARLAGRPARGGRAVHPALASAVVVLWAAAMLLPLRSDARRVHDRFVLWRERMYATAAVWAGHVAPEGPYAAVEIGTVGFFAPPQVEVLDLFGIARSPGERRWSAVELVRRRRPVVVVIRREDERYKRVLERVLPGRYAWEEAGALWLGLRADRAPRLRARLPRFGEIYRDIRLDRTYRGSEAPAPRPPGKIP